MTPRLCLAVLLMPLSACISRGVPPADLERTVALQALADELGTIPSKDTIFLLNRFIAATSRTRDSTAWLDNTLPERYRARVPPSLFYRYWQANLTSARLEAPGRLGDRPVRLINEPGKSPVPGVEWVYSLSRVGFSRGLDSALVTVSLACRGLCGRDDLYLYVKGANGWEQRRTLLTIDR